MFTINSNWVIKMNKGDMVQFPLYINNGTRVNPIRYEFEPNDGCEVIFYLLPVHGSFQNYILKKTYTSSGNITTQKINDEEIITTEGNININEFKDMVITLDEGDTIDLCPGEYTYIIRAKVLTNKINSKNLVNTSEYTTLQVTNRYFFYLLDDDINRAE